MTRSIDIRELLPKDGTSRKQRRLRALDPDFVRLDDRDVEDFLVFALRFARQVVYYDLSNRPTNGTGEGWRPFFGYNATVVIADVVKTNPFPDRRRIEAVLAGPNTVETLRALFRALIGLARKIDDWEQSLDAASAFTGAVNRLIRANLAAFRVSDSGSTNGSSSSVLAKLAAYERAAARDLDGYGPFDPKPYEDFGSSWNLDIAEVGPDASLFGGYDEIEDQIAAAKGPLEEIFSALYATHLEIIRVAPDYFEKSLERTDHAPHIALFIAFLQLFLHVRDDGNGMTRRHLEFFYERVLRLKRKQPDPDHVHLVVVPAAKVLQARGIDEVRIPAGTAFDAGKDASGVDLVYELDDDLVANLAAVDSLRTIYVDSTTEPSGEQVVTGLYAAPIADSGDGQGGDFEDEESPSWPSLGSSRTPAAGIGFAVASRELLLGEGIRTITLSIFTGPLPDRLTSPDADLADVFSISLSGEEGWIEPEDVKVCPTSDDGLTFKVTLELADEAVVAFDAEALGVDYGTTLPVLRVSVNDVFVGDAHAYESLRALEVERITLDVVVKEARGVVLQNDQSVLDPTNAFQPWGPLPKSGAAFYVGSAEAFQKHLDSVKLNVEWDDLPDSFSDHYKGYEKNKTVARSDFKVNVTMLNPRKPPSENGGAERVLFPSAGDEIEITDEISASDVDNLRPPLQPADLEGYGSESKQGLLKLKLVGDFLHGMFASALARQSLAAAKYPDFLPGAVYEPSDPERDNGTITDEAVVVIPKEPYTPTIKKLTLGYKSSIDTAEDAGALALIHLHPFENAYERYDLAETAPLLPQFDHEGQLFIGIKDLKPMQSLSILFQVAEATADTDLAKADAEWHYLASNEWRPFEDYEITQDTTDGLITSGIVRFAVPPAIDKENTILPSTHHWIRAAVKSNAAAVSELIGMHAQAGRATFADRGNDPGHLAAPLPAETVAGPVEDDAALEGVEQPYPSFGGRPAEEGLPFYTRVSEHLRHKGRAITRFDYERLVLEEFPDIYKVKCLNHTDDRHRIAPGHVLVAVIPDFTELKAADRRAPKVTLARLERIKKFLNGVNSPFVGIGTATGRLYVLNPVYEEVRVAFNVRFRPEVTSASFYLRELRKAIVRYLSPWAFKEGGEISFGGRVFKSSILNFVEEQSYVDFVTDFEMMHMDSDRDVDVIEVTTPRSILIPAIESRHKIVELTSPTVPMREAIRQEGIGAMTVAEDFQVYDTQDFD